MKIQKLIASTIVLGSIFTLGFTCQVSAAAIGNVAGNNVNVRNEANVSGAVIETVNNGAEVEIKSKNGDWYGVSYEGQDNAYISSDYVTVVQATGSVTGTEVNVRNAASTSADVVAKTNAGDTLTVTGQNGDWYEVRRTNGDTAYVSSSFVSGEFTSSVPSFNVESVAVVSTYAIVTSTSGLKLRESASTSASSMGTLDYDTVVDVVEVGSEWIKVKTDTGLTGYVSAEFVSVRTGEKPSRSISSSGSSVVSYAKQFLGTPYVWGGTNLNSGVDCSGFVYSVMKNFGVSLNRSSASMASNGVYVDRGSLMAGDLVFFDTTNATNQGYISHVGIYMGDGNIIHSSSSKVMSVTIDSLSSDYYNTKYVTARRVLR